MSFIFLMQIIFTKVKVESISVKDFLSVLWQSIIGALILGFLEELIFRGLILRCFYTAWGAFLGISLSSAFFAYKHFKVPGVIWNSIDLHTAHWYSGFTVAYYDAIGIFMTFNLLEFLSLFLFGSYLCTIYVTTKTLYSSIAFHFAAVLTIMLHRSIFSPDMSDSLRIFFGGTGATNSYLAVILLSIMILLQLFFDKKSRE